MATTTAFICQRTTTPRSCSAPSRVLFSTPILKRRLRSRLAAFEEEEENSIGQVLPPPQGVTQPKRFPDIPPGRFGFVEYAERLNSRAAMIGFFGILIVEFIANRGILELVGLNVGSGLGFEI